MRALAIAVLGVMAVPAWADDFAHERTAPAALLSARAGDDARPPVGGARLWRVHDAPKGWTYPFACCSGQDCRPVADVRETAAGFVVRSGETVAYSDVRIRRSPDGDFHWCSVAGADDGRTICLFVPPRSF
jgi:hypothetical protein